MQTTLKLHYNYTETTCIACFGIMSIMHISSWFSTCGKLQNSLENFVISSDIAGLLLQVNA